MFERYITDALTTHFGHILENVDSDKMRLSAWDGELTLEDVSIKSTALDTILRGQENCPVEIAYGHIGAFRVKIPWSLLSGLISGSANMDDADASGAAAAISIVLTDVDILITPRRKVTVVSNDNDGEHDGENGNDMEENDNEDLSATSEMTLDTRRSKKERKVQSLLDANLLKRVTESSILAEEDKKVSWAGWLREKLAQLLSNLSITLKNIHIRYEDPGTSMGFEWRVFHHHESNNITNSNLVDQYSKLSLNLNATSSSPLSRRTLSSHVADGYHRAHGNGNLQPRRFRPAFAVGITLKEFSVQSTKAPRKKQQSPELDEINNSEDNYGRTLDDASTSVVSATTATSASAGFSTTAADDFLIRRQHKRAAANDLAIYWDSTATLICGRAIRKFQSHQLDQQQTEDPTTEDHQKQQEIKKESFDFYQSSFSILNERPPSQQTSTKIRAKHSYLLDPVSPSVDLTLVSKLPNKSSTKRADTVTEYDSDDASSETPLPSQSVNKKTSEGSYYSIPPSSIKVELPPCFFTLSKNTLEDTVYLRKSLTVWTDARKTIVSESALRRIIKLRPSESAKTDPVGWWKYAFEATKVMTRASLSSEMDEIFEEKDNVNRNQTKNSAPDNLEQKSQVRRSINSFTRRRGWMGLIEAASRRRKYCNLYKVILEPPISPTEKGDGEHEIQKVRQEEAHDSLLKMEDELLTREMVAFRIHAYEYMKKQGELDSDERGGIRDRQAKLSKPASFSSKGTINDENSEQSVGRWATWIGRGSSDNPTTTAGLAVEDQIANTESGRKHAMMKGETDEEMLSIEHRRWMMNEMKQALDRERSNMQNQSRESIRKSSVLQMNKDVLLAGDMPINESNPVVWTASLVCRKFAIQINDQHVDPDGFRHHSSAAPVMRLSSAWVQDQSWFHDGSWDVDVSLASMEVIDLISGRGRHSNSRYVSTLLGSHSRSGTRDNEFLLINGIQYHRNMSAKIKRRLHWNVPIDWLQQESNIDRGSTTTFKIQVLPMEIIYSALPIETVKRVFLTVKTPEIVDDYHKVLGVAKSWRNKQKNKLLETLAHKNKQIVVDIDIAAPELLIPEDVYRPDSPMLAINFGRFQAYNDDEKLDSKTIGDFDDQWRVLVSNIQVQSTSMASHHSHSLQELLHEQLVEPLSIDISVSTKFTKVLDQSDSKESRISVSATLPRLAFNITSSAIRLMSRLRLNFAKREREIHGEAALYGTHSALDEYTELANTRKKEQLEEKYINAKLARDRSERESRVFKFDFSAPAITLKLENDVDGRNYTNGKGSRSTPILDLALRSIQGSFSQELTSSGDSMIKFEAKLRSLGVIDLYQNAGNDFALLMSSVPRNQLSEEINAGTVYSWDTLHANHDANEVYEISKDLVMVEYSSNITPATDSTSDDGEKEFSNDDPDKISLWFHELYIEWNPETLAAIHAAMRTTSIEEHDSSDDSCILPSTSSEEDESSAEDEFFDAFQEELCYPSDSDSLRPISEVSTSADDLAALGNTTSNGSFEHGVSSPVYTSTLSPVYASSLSPTFGSGLLGHNRLPLSPGSRSSFGVGQFHSARMYESGYIDALKLPQFERETDRISKRPRPRRKEIIFRLSKLRVSFNKETRHRKVIVAQMDRTFVSYSTKVTGGSRIQINLGNLVFIDPAHEENKTLYGQILGLQTKSKGVDENSFSSLLEMEIIMNPKVRNFASIINGDKSNTVTIDKERGKMAGSNNCVTAKLSPMRFVLIEQLWMEIMDYFFQGIIGTEVLGGKKKELPSNSPLPSVELKPIDSDFAFGSDAEGISFTRFDVSLDSPVIIFPVTYSSTDYLRMKLSKICLSNEYDGAMVSDIATGIDGINKRMQWFNNCKISLDDLRLYSWSGRELSRNPVMACVALRWPTGPLAPLIIPKWRVKCSFDTLDISLCRSDYALLQNILSYNIGELSRHMDEWRMLQTLSQNTLDEFVKNIIVHYGYDQKNVAPSTYDVRLSVSSLRARFLESDNEDSVPLAIARCFNLKWQMRKESDLIVKQKVTCGIDLVRPARDNSGFETLMTISKDISDFDGEEPDFIYSSTSFPNGDNVKTIHMFDPCIYMVVPAWSQFVAFFQSLSSPIFLSEKEIGTSIQVGDRWYRIGDDGTSLSNPYTSLGMGNVGKEVFSWISSEPTGVNSSGLAGKLPAAKRPSTFQLKLLLTWPRIILSSVTTDDHPTHVILRMNHLEFLHTNEGRKFKKTRSLFLHDVEVYTSSQELSTLSIHSTSKDEEHNSLIRPWSLSALTTTCNGESLGDCEQHTYKISGDVLRARAAYSDMSIAIDVFLSVLHTAKEKRNIISDNDLPQHPILSNNSYDSSESLMVKSCDDKDADNEELCCTKPSSIIYDIQFDGFELKVADDSGRHFSGSQDLAILSIGKTLFSRHESKNGIASMKLWLDCLDLFDCLQPISSPFRTAASSHSKNMGIRTSADDGNHFSQPNNLNEHDDVPRKMPWEDFATKYDGRRNFELSQSFLNRIEKASKQCSHYLWGEGGESPTPGLIEIAYKLTEGNYQEYDIRFRKFAVQWNPSTIIAMQRFSGRLRKESKLIADQVFRNQFDDIIDGSNVDEKAQKDMVADLSGANSLIRATIQIDSLTVCMNKEHQHRRLLELTLSSCNVVMRSSDQGITIEGEIGDLSAFDCDNYVIDGLDQDHITKKNRSVLSVLTDNEVENSGKFLHVCYKTFTKKATSASKADVPEWIKHNLPSPDDIDDFLSLTIAATRFTYLKERTNELLDYLSNGLPGKGMGATSRAAKGFISRRIQTRSFLQLRVNSPQIFAPQHEMAEQGLGLKLGDVNIQSWFEEATSTTKDSIDSEWWRVLSLKLSGFSYGMVRMGSNFDSLSSATNPIDLDILLRKPTIKGRTLSIRGMMSSFEVVLHYEDYALLRAVAKDNIGRHVNTDKWDNVEKAYWLETEDADHRLDSNGSAKPDGDVTKKVAYSTNARFVRYGKGGKKGMKQAHSRTSGQTDADESESASTLTLDVRFDLAGVALKLRRNDLPEGIAEDDDLAAAFHYNVMLLRVGVVEVLTTANAAGDLSFNLSLFRVGLFDLGDSGRLIRQRYYHSLPGDNMMSRKSEKKTLPQPCPFVVLAEGYLSADDNDVVVHEASDLDGPEFVISVDVCPASSTNGFLPQSETALPPNTKVTVAKVVINYLSLNAIIRPFREIADFLSCAWPIRSKITPQYQRVDKIELHTTEKKKSPDIDKMYDSVQGFQLKVVAHYPRVFFLADESDLNSRALVLKGLAVANISTVNKREISGSRNSGSIDIQQITSVGAQLHGLETYINPDVSAALRFRQRHCEMVGKEFSPSFNPVSEDEVEDNGDLGVALIQPVTIGIEYMQVKRDLFPTRRSLQINIDPVSTMLSFEDLQLVEIVLKRWSRDKGKKSDNATNPEDVLSRSKTSEESLIESKPKFQVVFNTMRLGLGLRTEESHVVVTSIQNPAYNRQIKHGDILISVGDESVLNMPLEQIVEILAISGRPVIVGFERNATLTLQETDEGATTDEESPSEEDIDEDSVTGYPISCYSLHFRSGMQLGLVFEKSVCGQFPVVSKLLSTIDETVVLSGSVDETDTEQIEVVDSVFNSEHTRVPRVGAVVVAVDEVPVEELGAEEVWQVLSKMQDSDVSPGLIGSDIASDVTFSLTFQETHSSTWGKIDSIEISSAGMALSFIDDLNGRDMPLLRGKMSSVEIHIERGLGINAHILDNTIPSLLTPLYADSDEDVSDMILSIEQVQDIQTESIVSFSAISICSVDYFRPRVSFWEPLLEPSQLFFHFEKQDGSVEANRPAQIALEVSDRLLHDQFKRATFTQNNHLGEAHMVSINVTDAAAEVLVEGVTRWKDWRNNLRQESEEVDIEYADEIALEEGRDPPESGLSNMHTVVENVHFQGEVRVDNQQQLAQKAAAKKAAQGALIFAQKRGAETSKKSDSAKPFIFRNRTGISIAFVQHGLGLRTSGYAGWTSRKPGGGSSFTATIGEYDGLEEYGQESITELADQEDAKFNMDLIDEHFGEDLGQRRNNRQFANKIRSYEGRYPDLTVAIQAVAGILVEPITDLQVLKVGSTIRHLTVKKDNGTYTGSDSTRNSIQVVWNVEIEDNRRILTLSTAVRVVSAGISMPIEIGYRYDGNDDDVDYTSENSINAIGISRSDCPFYMPLWLALKLEPVSVYVRPASASTTEQYWSESSVLHFGLFVEERMIADGRRLNALITGRWTWEETFSGLRCICCRSRADEKYPTWFSVFGSSSSYHHDLLLSNYSGDKLQDDVLHHRNEYETNNEVLSITLDSGLTIRNMLPAMIEMEVVQGDEPGAQSEFRDKKHGIHFSFDEVEPDVSKFDTLKGGECTEVFEVNYIATAPKLRIKHQDLKGWSTWAPLELNETTGFDDDGNDTHPNEITATESTAPAQVNVQIPGGDFGIPMTFGVRIEPKMTNDDTHRGCVYGLEVIIYAELWIRNITSLPLNFGCPAYQLYEPEQSLPESPCNNSIAKFTAESALMELTSLLEVGDKGRALNQRSGKEESDRSNLIESLPGQQCRELTEEVFEYVEIESSIVKRKWWASESYDGYHNQIFHVKDTGANWKWLDEKWVIDSSGGAKPSVGGWESCKNLCIGNGSFGGNREFNPSDGFRRRRFFRRRSGYLESYNRSFATGLHSQRSSFSLTEHTVGIHAFHQPVMDAFSREQKKIKQSHRKEDSTNSHNNAFDDKLKIAIRCGDGTWSSPAEISDTGTCYGVIRSLASRWPRLTKRHGDDSQSKPPKHLTVKRNSYSAENPTQDIDFKSGCLGSDLYEFCYTVSDIDGEWGEFSRSMEVSPRFLVRNDSKTVHMKVKQAGAPNSTCVTLRPGEASPFYWADFRLPKLVSAIPFDTSETNSDKFKWSGGFDLCNLGMTPVRIRSDMMNVQTEVNSSSVTSIRVLVEVRPGTGGHGINVSLREEAPNGDGSLFRIENLSPFPIWLSQDGVLANPISLSRNTGNSTSLVDGDYMPPNSKSTFALDVPYRQGKYAHRKEASLSELMHVRAALAPLSSRAGIESVKVIGFATMGETIRLNPTKLPSQLISKSRDILQSIRVLGVVATDGPTRVLRFCLMVYPMSEFTIPDMSYVTTTQSPRDKILTTSSQKNYTEEISIGISEAIKLAMMGTIPTELEAKRNALFADLKSNIESDVDHTDGGASDKVFSFRVEFSGFIFSLVDSAPSEIALASLRNVNALARWNNLRSTDATLLLSIGWLQIDNHIPSAPFKVAVRPDVPKQQQDERAPESSPLLVVAVAFAPEHKSKIVVLRSVTVAPRDLVIALDLAFLVRLQRFFIGLQDHVRKRHQDINLGSQPATADGTVVEQKKMIPFPNFMSPEKQLEHIAAFSENRKMYFQGLTILPTNIKLSVAPAKALTLEQASLEGKETAAIHTAVRKGDVLVGGKSVGPLGVRVGKKNRTPLAVVRGVFKSIVVDALLRLSGASLNFHGVFLRNHIATSTQLSTYLAAHYLSSLKYNVPALLGSLSAIGNPLGLIRGIGDGVSDFVTEPIQGFKRAMKELDPGYAVDGVARGTESLARHTVGGIADSASLLMETFSKYMAVVTLDRRYAQKRDRRKSLRLKSDAKVTLVGGVESGFLKLVQGFQEGVTGVVKAPIRGAEKRGFEGFAKGLGKGLLGLLVKPIIGITDAATDVMIGVKSTVEYKEAQRQNLALLRNQFRPRRPMYGRDKVLRPYSMEDAAAATLMLKTRCAGENYLSHLEMNDRVALLSIKRLIILGPKGQEQLALKFKHVNRLEVRSIRQEDGISEGWGIIVVLNTPRRNGSDVEVISCRSEQEAIDLCMLIQRGVDLVSIGSIQNT